ncbi:MAG: hypothetical protein AAF514_00070 [Verrucomicrobiota bacterium]
MEVRKLSNTKKGRYFMVYAPARDGSKGVAFALSYRPVIESDNHRVGFGSSVFLLHFEERKKEGCWAVKVLTQKQLELLGL